MKKTLITSFLFLLTVSLFSQEISVKSFKPLSNDLTARMNPVTNDNAQTCALLKIITTETNFTFETDALGLCQNVEYKTAEIWLWLSPGSRLLTIKHPQLGQLRNYEYPVAIESACTYEMVLTTAKITTIVEEQNKQNFVRLSVSPTDALVKIDGNTVVTNNGQYSKMLSVGEHTCECFCPLYYSYKQNFTILPNEKTTLDISLKPNYGFIKVTSTPENGAAVFIDGRQVGTTPYTSNKLESKTYTVQVAKEMWQDASQQVTVKDNQTSSAVFTLQPNFAEPLFIGSDVDAEIWINGEKKGVGRWSGRLPVGAYKVEAKKVSHVTIIRQITLEAGDNNTITIDAPTPIYGKISVNTEPFDADILLDGKKVATSPELLNNILIGSHELKLQKAGCSSVTKNITVKEGETIEINETLKQGKVVTLNSNPKGASLYVDGSYVGTAPLSLTLDFGTHTVRAELGEVKKEQTLNVTESGQSSWTFDVQQGFQRCGDKMKDYDGNEYNTVQIGNQCWMKENLRTTHYSDGTSISLGSSTSISTAYRYYPNNNSSNVSTYGYLYNSRAVMHNSSSSSANPSGVQGICPKGWHVPSDAEWTQLTDYVGSQSKYQCNGSSSNIAKALASITGWKSSSYSSAVGNNPSSNNATGFSAVPAGYYFGIYNYFGYGAYFWSATLGDSYGAYCRGLTYHDAYVSRSYSGKIYAYSVRCLRDK